MKRSLRISFALLALYVLVLAIAFMNIRVEPQHTGRPQPTFTPPPVSIAYGAETMEARLARMGLPPELGIRAQQVCAQLAAGGVSEYDIDIQMSEEGWTDDERWFALDLNVEKYCPKYLYLVR